MKGCLKTCLIIAGILLILGAVASLLLASQAGAYLKGGVEAALTAAAGAPATIERFEILPLRQCIHIQGLAVNNPPGWKSEPAMTVDSVLVTFDAKSLFSKTPRITCVDVQGATVNLRYDLTRGWNLAQLAKTAPDVPGEQTAAIPRPARKAFRVEECRCRDIKVCLVGALLPGKMLNLNVAPFNLTDFKEQPVTIAQSTGIFLRSVLTETLTLKGLLKPIQTEIQHWLQD